MADEATTLTAIKSQKKKHKKQNDFSVFFLSLMNRPLLLRFVLFIFSWKQRVKNVAVSYIIRETQLTQLGTLQLF